MVDRRRLRRWHIWLGWLIAIPMVLWISSGLVMVAKPIEEVRGEHLLSEPPSFELTSPPVAPIVEGRKLHRIALEPRAAGPRWVLLFADGGTMLADPATGRLLPPYSAAEAVREVTARYTGEAKVAAAKRTDRDHPPFDLRRPIDAWQVTMTDGTHFYVDLGSGEIVARRTGWWRFFDFMWGLHIMDPQTREDTHNPWVIGFGLLTLVSTLLAMVLLPMTIRRNERKARSRRAD